MNTIEAGTKVIANGYAGVITAIHTGELAGLADVRLGSGEIVTSLSELTVIA